MKEYQAMIGCTYRDNGERIKVDFNYKDSNGASVSSSHEGSDVDDVTSSILADVMTALQSSTNETPKDPADMTKDELINALKLMEKEANEQRTKNEMLEKRLAEKAAASASAQKQKQKIATDNKHIEETRKAKYDNAVNDYRDLLKILFN